MCQESLDLIRKRQEHHLAFWNHLESIRWRITSAFGIGAGIALIVSKEKLNDEISISALVMLIFISLAAIAVQIRIFGLINVLWHKINILQKLEIDILKDKDQLFSSLEDNEKHFYFPRASPDKGLSKFFTVTFITSSVFAMLINISVFALGRIGGYGIFHSLIISVLSFILIILSVSYLKRKFESYLMEY